MRCLRQCGGDYCRLQLHEDRTPISVYFCDDCGPAYKDHPRTAFSVECDRCGDRPPSLPTLPSPEEFKAWGRGFPGDGMLGRCVKCENLCAACGSEIEEPAPDWTPVAKAGVCSPLCAIAVRLPPPS